MGLSRPKQVTGTQASHWGWNSEGYNLRGSCDARCFLFQYGMRNLCHTLQLSGILSHTELAPETVSPNLSSLKVLFLLFRSGLVFVAFMVIMVRVTQKQQACSCAHLSQGEWRRTCEDQGDSMKSNFSNARIKHTHMTWMGGSLGLCCYKNHPCSECLFET